MYAPGRSFAQEQRRRILRMNAEAITGFMGILIKPTLVHPSDKPHSEAGRVKLDDDGNARLSEWEARGALLELNGRGDPTPKSHKSSLSEFELEEL